MKPEAIEHEVKHLMDMVQKQIVATVTQLELLTEQYEHLTKMLKGESVERHWASPK